MFGYEGYVKVGGCYALGTGTSFGDSTQRIESGGAYGGKVKDPVDKIAILTPRTYDWVIFTGSVSFEMTRNLFANEIVPWVFDRQAVKVILFSSRNGNVQQFNNCFWQSISFSTSAESVVDGQISLSAFKRDAYVWGLSNVKDDYIKNVTGKGLLCEGGGSGFPLPLNAAAPGFNNNPIPYWKTKILCDDGGYDFVEFTDWAFDLSQDVVPFFACEGKNKPQEPKFMAVGVMSISFNGSYLRRKPLPYFLDGLRLDMAGVEFGVKTLEMNTANDDVVAGESLVPLVVEYNVYELE